MTDATRNLLEQHFDTAFAAPDGIAKLRELILTLAMQGKLVAQDPNDPPASELLKEIEAEKLRLVKAGKIKKPKPLPPIKPEEVPYQLPQGWSFVRNGFLFALRKGQVPKDLSETQGSIPYLDIEALDRGNVRRYTDDGKAPQSTDKDILVVCDGSRSGLVLDGQNGAIGSTLSVIDTPQFIQPFVKLIFRQGYQRLNSTMKGAAIPHLDTKNLLLEVTGLPPLPEQHRIVARIDQLMARCDALEKLRKEREEKRLAVHAATIKQLLDAPEGSAWEFIEQYFGELYTVKENVAELRKAILQLAVMGRLVEQNPNDPPASQLLKEIEAEKQRLVKAGKIKNPKPLPPIKPEEVPYELPQGWEWVRFGEIAFQITDGAHHTPTYIEEGIPFLSVKDMSSGALDFCETRFISPEQHRELIKRCYPKKGDLLLTKVGTTGIPVLVDVDCEFSIFVSVALIKFPQHLISGKFLSWLVKSPLVKKQSEDGTEGVGNKNLVLRKIANFLLALPSLPEQHRIVARINQLMALCDTLDQQIDAATGKQTKLLNAVMAQV
jgi:type I restriction enzyme S subunit